MRKLMRHFIYYLRQGYGIRKAWATAQITL